MASLPPQRFQRQQSDARGLSNEGQATAPRRRSQSPSTKSLDSQTLLLNEPPASSSTLEPSIESRDIYPSADRTDMPEPRKCWICFSDETEDTPNNNSKWKTPCPCALTAHESCLLDWIADMEAPEGNRSAATTKEIKCPQCKAQIHLARPHSFVVEAMGRIEKLTGQMLLPGVVLGSAYTLLIGSSHHGAHTIRMIFGPEDAEAILAPTPNVSLVEYQLHRYVPILARPFFRGWRGLRVELGLPVIPGALIASRTSFADTILPFLPILFFVTHPQHQQELTLGFWPPSAALTFVVLPYVRSIYEECLERVWGERERQWMKEIRPRLGREEDDDDGQDHTEEQNDEDGDMVQLQIDIEEEIEDEDNAEQAAPPPDIQQERAVPAHQPPADGQQQQPDHAEVQGGEAEPQDQGEQDDQRNQRNNHHRHRVDINFLAYATRFAETTLGALLFPTVSAAMGETLRYALPASWIVARTGWGRPMPTGLLQTRWGRSVVGGCLFVVFKDAVRIYCRWKMAQAYRKRRVLDFDKQLGKVVW